MNDDLRVADAPGSNAPRDPVAATADPSAGPSVDAPTGARPKRERRWLGRLGLALVVLIAGVAIGFQVQTARVRNQVAEAETTQRVAELDRETARIRLQSVGDRVVLAQKDEAEAQGVLDASRQAMTGQGLVEAQLHDVQVAKANQVKDLRSQVRTLHTAVANQKRLQPAAGTCVFDLLRALEDRGAGTTDACRTTAAGGVPG